MKNRLLMILAVAVLLVGCGNTDKPDTEANKPQTETDSTTEALGADAEEETTVTESEKPHEHAYTDKVTKEATCTEAGEKTFTCECGDIYTEVIEATGHDYKDETKAPTCSEKGYTTHTCKTCGNSYTDTEVSATGHSYGKYTYNNDATYEKDGTETATCSACGKKNTRTKSGTKLVKEEPSPEPTPETPSNPSNSLEILNSNWHLRDDGIYESNPSTNIVADWEGQTLAEYCAARNLTGVSFTNPWNETVFMNTSKWGDYVIGSRKIAVLTQAGEKVKVKIPF